MRKGLPNTREKQIRAMLLAVIGEADYDLAKSFDPELSEDPEHSERTMAAMVRIVRGRLTEMIAAERSVVSEHWDVATKKEVRRYTWEYAPKRNEKWNADQRDRAWRAALRFAMAHGGKIKHVTRYRSVGA